MSSYIVKYTQMSSYIFKYIHIYSNIYEAVPKTVYPIAPRKQIYKKMYSEHPRLLYSLRLAAGRSIFLSKRIVSKSPSKPS